MLAIHPVIGVLLSLEWWVYSDVKWNTLECNIAKLLLVFSSPFRTLSIIQSVAYLLDCEMHLSYFYFHFIVYTQIKWGAYQHFIFIRTVMKYISAKFCNRRLIVIKLWSIRHDFLSVTILFDNPEQQLYTHIIYICIY